jgi:hypothetical protein
MHCNRCSNILKAECLIDIEFVMGNSSDMGGGGGGAEQINFYLLFRYSFFIQSQILWCFYSALYWDDPVLTLCNNINF